MLEGIGCNGDHRREADIRLVVDLALRHSTYFFRQIATILALHD